MSPEQARALYEHITWLQAAALETRVDLSRIRAQTLVVVGGRDRFLASEDTVRAQRHIPDCSVAVIPEAGHFLHLEQPGILSLYRRFVLQGKTVWGSRAMRVNPAPDVTRIPATGGRRPRSFA
jgi:pimeloyl-ACP methyl ester carboxylesterase